MNFIVSGANGYIGSYFCEAANRAGHTIVGNAWLCGTVGVHLEWQHLPNYASAIHYQNVWPRLQTILEWRRAGVKQILVVGSCLETVPNPPHYGRAKLLLLEEAQKLDICLQWVRLFNVYGGDRERSSRLVPRLRAAVWRGEKSFSVVDGVRDFLHVRTVVAHLLRIAEDGIPGVRSVSSGNPMFVADFCRSLVPANVIELTTDYPHPEYEPFEMVPA